MGRKTSFFCGPFYVQAVKRILGAISARAYYFPVFFEKIASAFCADCAALWAAASALSAEAAAASAFADALAAAAFALSAAARAASALLKAVPHCSSRAVSLLPQHPEKAVPTVNINTTANTSLTTFIPVIDFPPLHLVVD
jgi:hypothetical protein